MPYEIYMPIEGYEDTYAVSNLGQVKNIRTGRILKQRKCPDGYMHIDLYKDGKGRTYLVHRLVISAFKANPDNKPQVNHRNEIKTDNNLNNLEWSTAKDNINYGTHNERVAATLKANGTYDKIADKCSIPVYCITNNTVYKSAQDAARQLNLDNSSITKCLKGKFKQTGGHQFEYYKGDAE